MSDIPPNDGVHVIDAARLNTMQGVCEAARIWNRSKGEDKVRAEQSMIRAIVAYEALQSEEVE
jgi:hypothetical protein